MSGTVGQEAFEKVIRDNVSREATFDAMRHWKLLRDAGLKIVTCHRCEFDFTNLGRVITAIVHRYGAREESSRLADRVISGKRLAISPGKRQAGGRLPPHELQATFAPVLDSQTCNDLPQWQRR